MRITIETDDGHRDMIAGMLEKYGLIVSEKMSPTAFLNAPIDGMKLEHRLEMAQMELRHSRDMLQLEQRENQQLQARTTTLEAEVKELHQLAGGALQHSQQTVSQLVDPQTQRAANLAQLFHQHLVHSMAQDTEIHTALVVMARA